MEKNKSPSHYAKHRYDDTEINGFHRILLTYSETQVRGILSPFSSYSRSDAAAHAVSHRSRVREAMKRMPG